MRKIETLDNDILISSFDSSVDDLIKVACCLTSAFIALHPTPHMPKVIINDYDDIYGNSVLVEFRYPKEIK